jgi:ribosomal protein L24
VLCAKRISAAAAATAACQAPLHYSNVMLVDPLSQKPVRVYFKFEDQPPFKRVSAVQE